MSKRYYRLKLKDDFFSSIKIKKLRKNEDGNLLTIIYLKMQLLSVKNGGVLLFESVESSFEEELALVLDEEVTYVRQAVGFLRTQGMLEQLDDRQFLLTDAAPNIGSESESAARVRRLRCKRNAQPLHFDENVTADIDTEKEGETPQPIADDNLSKCEQKFEDINEFRPDGRLSLKISLTARPGNWMTILKARFSDTSLSWKHAGCLRRILAAAGVAVAMHSAHFRTDTYGHAGFCYIIFHLVQSV